MVLDKYKLLELVYAGVKNAPVTVVSVLVSPDMYSDLLDELMVYKDDDDTTPVKHSVDIKMDKCLPGGSIVLVMCDGSLKILAPVSLI